MRPRVIVALVACLAALSVRATDVSADGFDAMRDEPLEVTADRLEYDIERKLYIAAGNVRVVQAHRSLDADWVAFSSQTNLGVASGHVRVVRDDDVLLADFFEFEVDTLEGVVFGADLDAGADDFLVHARELAKTGDDTYRLREGSFTTCRCPEDGKLPWKLRAKKAEFELGGYATTRNATVEVLGVPALWLPWAIFPIKTARQSGLLFPELGVGGNNGFEIGVPIFWAARDQLNVVFTPRYLSKRGFKQDLALDYVQGRRSRGKLAGSFIHDTEVADLPEAERPFSPNRWAALWNHDQHLPADWRFKADVKLTSDNRHPTDFEDLERYRNYRYLESSVFAFNHFGQDGRFGATGAVRWADDLQDRQVPDSVDPDLLLLQRLPDIDLDILPGTVPHLPGLVATMGTDYTYFSSRKTPDEPLGVPGPGEDFDESVLTKDRGHRLSFHPRLAYPVRFFDRFELHPEIGYYETLYSTAADGFSQRGLVTGRVDLRTRFTGQLEIPFAAPLRHLMEARASWTYVQDKESSQLDTPFFVRPTAVPQEFLRQLEPENIVLDAADFIPRANLLTLGFGNRFYAGKGSGVERLLADLTLSAGYDFARERWARLNVDGATFPVDGIRTRFMLSFDPGEPRIEEALIEASSQLPVRSWFKGGAVGLGYRYRRQLPIFFDDRDGIDRVNQIGAFTRLNLTPRWSISYAFNYSLAGGLLLQNQGGLNYTSACRCWRIALEIRQDRVRDVEFRVGFSLLGLGDAIGVSDSLFR